MITYVGQRVHNGYKKNCSMISVGFGLVLLALAFVVTMLVYPLVLKYALVHKIVDNPNVRKLQRVPVPVMGGTTVLVGFLVAFLVAFAYYQDNQSLIVAAIMLVMYFIGTWDDRHDMSAALRFAIEIGVVWIIMLLLGVEINNFHGLWGLYEIPDMVSVPLSIIAGVGIINAINLIDGVDGYCSFYGIMACLSFAILFYFSGERMMFNLSLSFMGALVPFFLHNVFGGISKMFLGDGGSLVMGTVLTLFVFTALSSGRGTSVLDSTGLSLSAFVLAVAAIPVFDTLRVMTTRVICGHSPFHPDKTHLHHLFIEMNFAHLVTSAIIVLANFFIVLCQLLSWRLGASVDFQLYLVIGLGLLFTTGFYYFMDYHHRKNDGEGSKFYKSWCRIGLKSHSEGNGLWHCMQRLVDSRFLAGRFAKSMENEAEKESNAHVRPDPRIK